MRTIAEDNVCTGSTADRPSSLYPVHYRVKKTFSKDIIMFSRGSGILLHISSLPSIHGIGDLGPEAYRFVDKLQAAFQSYWQVLPLNPTYGGSHNSPYFSSSTAAGNPLLISLELLVEQGLLSAEELPGCIFSPHWVNYPAVSLYKQSILKTAYERFKAHKDSSRFRKF